MSLELIFKKNDLTTIVFLYLIQNKSLLEVAHSSTGVYENSEMLCDGCKKYTLKISNEKNLFTKNWRSIKKNYARYHILLLLYKIYQNNVCGKKAIMKCVSVVDSILKLPDFGLTHCSFISTSSNVKAS